jgi:hypothetical protein
MMPVKRASFLYVLINNSRIDSWIITHNIFANQLHNYITNLQKGIKHKQDDVLISART